MAGPFKELLSEFAMAASVAFLVQNGGVHV